MADCWRSRAGQETKAENPWRSFRSLLLIKLMIREIGEKLGNSRAQLKVSAFENVKRHKVN